MEEVIAERSKGAFALYICMSILCLILMGMGVFLPMTLRRHASA